MEISFVIPVYNVEKFFDGFLASLAEQLAEHSDVEAIFVDDGSTDRSGELAAEFASAYDDSVRAIRQTNQGVSAARNAGLKAATGRYVFFADPDDRLAPDCVSVIRKAVQSGDIDIAVFAAEIHYPDSVGRRTPVPVVSEPISGAEFMLRQLNAAREIERPCWNKVYRREFLNREGIRFPADLRLSEDMVFNVCAFYAAERVCSADTVVYHYGKANPSSVTFGMQKDLSSGLPNRLAALAMSRSIATGWPDDQPVRACLLAFTLREALRTNVKSIGRLDSRRDRRRLAAELLGETRQYRLREIYRHLTLTDLKLWLMLRFYAVT